MTKEEKFEEPIILVAYIGVELIDTDEIEDYVYKVAKRIQPKSFKGEMIIIPTNTIDSRIECINPKYITDKDLIFEHTILIKELQVRLQHQLEQIKKKKDGKN